MKRAFAMFVLGGLLLGTPALALQDGQGGGVLGGQEGGTVLDAKKAHEAIKKHAEAKGGDGKEEAKLYDEMVDAGVPPKEALGAVKEAVDEDVDTGKMRDFIKKKKKSGLKGKELAGAITKECKSRAAAKRKAKAAGGKKGKAGKGKSGKGDTGGFTGKKKKGGKAEGGKGEAGGDDEDDDSEEKGSDDPKKKRSKRDK